MAKTKTYFLCRNCGAMQPKWMGKCPDCGAWDSLEEMTKATVDPHRPRALSLAPDEAAANAFDPASGEDPFAKGNRGNRVSAFDALEPMPVGQIPPLALARVPTGVNEFDRVLGGGVVPGSAILLGGEPGIGKSTLLLQAADALAAQVTEGEGGGKVLYVTSEESAQQTQLRAKRLSTHNNPNLLIYSETNLEKISQRIQKIRPVLAIIDSIQMIYEPGNLSPPGSISQIKDCATDLVYLAKASGTAICLVGHVTKQGTFAGPKLLEHIVDTVLYFEGDTHHDHRIVRCVKNRFGNTLELGLFRMGEGGLEAVADAASLLLDREQHGTGRPSGSVITAALQGSRVLLVEVQALTAESMLGAAKRKVSGCDASRVAMIIAVLEKRAGLRLVDRDVFVNVVGGIRLSEPSADAAIALAIAGAHMNRGINGRTLVLGELGLLGEFRPVSQAQHRLSEAARLGFEGAIVPAVTAKNAKPGGNLALVPCKTLDQAVQLLT